jgi:ADP-heptose:LPS heptosyltransferase
VNTIQQAKTSPVLVHLSSGIGNIVLATPLLVALEQLGFRVDVRLDADYPETVELLQGWSLIHAVEVGRMPEPLDHYGLVIPAVPPFYWARFWRLYRNCPNALHRPPDALFAACEQSYYLEFAYRLGYPREARPFYCLPIGPSMELAVGASTVVLAPGCKTGEMAAKRWPFFPELAERLDDVVVVGTRDDTPSRAFPAHARLLVDRLTLRQTAQVLASAGAVVGNDAGLSHIAGAVGTPTLMLFGPTSDQALGRLPPNVRILRAGLACEPCWSGARFGACAGKVTCLAGLSVDLVERNLAAARAYEQS